MVDGQNAKVLQDIADGQRAAAQPDLHVAPTITEPPLGNETPNAASTPVVDEPPAVVSPVVEPVAKVPSGRRGSAAAQ